MHEKLRSLPFMQDTVNSFSQRATSIKRRAHGIGGDAISFNNTASSSKPLILAKQPQAQSVDRRIQKELEYSKPCKELKTLEIYPLIRIIHFECIISLPYSATCERLFSCAGCLLGAANKIYCLELLATFQISSEQKLSGSLLADMNLK